MLVINALAFVVMVLAACDHVVELGGSLCNGDGPWFETAVTYHLHVEE